MGQAAGHQRPPVARTSSPGAAPAPGAQTAATPAPRWAPTTCVQQCGVGVWPHPAHITHHIKPTGARACGRGPIVAGRHCSVWGSRGGRPPAARSRPATWGGAPSGPGRHTSRGRARPVAELARGGAVKPHPTAQVGPSQPCECRLWSVSGGGGRARDGPVQKRRRKGVSRSAAWGPGPGRQKTVVAIGSWKQGRPPMRPTARPSSLECEAEIAIAIKSRRSKDYLRH